MIPQSHPKVLDARIDGSLPNERIGPPYETQQRVAVEHAVGVLHEGREEIVLEASQVQIGPVEFDTATHEVDE